MEKKILYWLFTFCLLLKIKMLTAWIIKLFQNKELHKNKMFGTLDCLFLKSTWHEARGGQRGVGLQDSDGRILKLVNGIGVAVLQA